jgi:5-formyltetrahydrofolate cyclo-ligase
MIGFNSSCDRLGYGGGFYDRTIAKLRQNKRILTIGVAFEVQKFTIEDLPRVEDGPQDSVTQESFDERLEYIVTEHRVYERT